jgi:hypothetical protein
VLDEKWPLTYLQLYGPARLGVHERTHALDVAAESRPGPCACQAHGPLQAYEVVRLLAVCTGVCTAPASERRSSLAREANVVRHRAVDRLHRLRQHWLPNGRLRRW